MITINSLKLITTLSNTHPNPIINKQLNSHIVAILAVYNQQLPSSPLEHDIALENYYSTNILNSIKDYVFDINESIIVDTDTILNLSLKYYKVRYNAVHYNDSVIIKGFLNKNVSKTVLDTLSGITYIFSTDELEFVNQYAEEINVTLFKLVSKV